MTYTIRTFAGSGRPNLGDGGPATLATLAAPERVLTTASGIVYIADTNNNRVVAVNGAGVIATLAGSVSAENQALGDGGQATDSVVRFPHALFQTANGVFIGDHSYTVRFVAGGVISHAALPDRAAFILPSAVVVDAAGNIYIADRSHNQVFRSNPDGSVQVIAGNGAGGNVGDGGLATLAQLQSPTDLRFDAQGHLLIGSPAGPLRQIDLSTGVITTRLPNAMDHFDFDLGGAFIVARGNQVLRVNPSTGAETVIAGANSGGFSGDGGAAINARFSNIQGVSVDADGNIFVADTGNNRIREITPGGIVTTFAGGGPSVASLTSVSDSQGIAFDPSENLYITDFQYHFIRRVLPDGTTTVVAGIGAAGTSGDGGAAINAGFDHPSIIRFDTHGRLFFMDLNWGTGAVRMIVPGADGVVTGAADEIITTIAGRNVDRALADHGAADGGLARNAVFVAARDFLFDSRGDMIIADWQDNRIRMVNPGADGVFNGSADEVITTIAGNGGAGQTGDGGLAAAANVEAPVRLAIDAQDNLYIWVGNNTLQAGIRRIDAATGVITTLVHGVNVSDMIVDHSGRLFYSDGTAQIFQVDTSSGARTVIAGSGQIGFGGDGGSALTALFRGASYLAVDDNDSLYVVDNGNFRVRQLILDGGNGAPEVILGNDNANTLIGANGNDYLYAYAGNDTASGNGGVDVLILGAGNDVGNGGAGQDYLFGEEGDDTLNGGDGVDVLLGGAGNDVMYGGDGGDYFYGEDGNDTGNGGDGNDIFVMGAGNDTASGDDGQDYFYMGDGDDVMNGGAGVDVMLGEAGNDTFNGGLGVDYLFLGPQGAGDNDTVIVDRANSGVQVVFGFEGGGTNDTIRLVGSGLTTFQQVQANISDFTASGGFCILTLDADTSVWFIGVAPNQLTSADFVFA